MKLKVISLVILLSGCSSVQKDIESLIVNPLQDDLKRTEELALKYNAPNTAACSRFLLDATVGVEGLASEPTSGIFSKGLKLALLRRLGQQSEDAFVNECGPLAARMLIEMGRSLPGVK